MERSKLSDKLREKRKDKRTDAPRVDLSKWEPQLGTVPDSKIAKLSGLSRSRIQARREELGIPAMRQERRYSAGDDRVITSGGKLAEIAAKLGVSPRAALLRRRWLESRLK